MIFLLTLLQEQVDTEIFWVCDKDWLDAHVPQRFLQQYKDLYPHW